MPEDSQQHHWYLLIHLLADKLAMLILQVEGEGQKG